MTHFYWVSMPPVLRVSAPVTSKFCYLLHAWNSTRNSNQIVHRYPAREENFTGSSIFTYLLTYFTYLLGLLWPKLFWHESWFAICLQCSSVANADAMVSPETYESCLQELESYTVQLANVQLIRCRCQQRTVEKGLKRGMRVQTVDGGGISQESHTLSYWFILIMWTASMANGLLSQKNNFLNKLAS